LPPGLSTASGSANGAAGLMAEESLALAATRTLTICDARSTRIFRVAHRFGFHRKERNDHEEKTGVVSLSEQWKNSADIAAPALRSQFRFALCALFAVKICG